MGVSTLFYAMLGNNAADGHRPAVHVTSVTVANIGVQDGILRVVRKGTTT